MAKLWLAKDRLSHHINIVGATGTRKSSIIRGLVYQALDWAWPCVFLDVKSEYFTEFYVEGRDYLINFADERCVRWMIGQEAIDEPHAMPIGEGAFPDEPGRSFFFQDHARAILAYLIGNYHPSTSQLAEWICNPEETDRRLIGSEHESTMSKNSADQRNGIIGTLNHLVKALRWMPDEPGRREFSVTKWAQQGKNRKGHIFLSSSANTFAALRPMHSLIVDLVLLGLQTYGAPAMVILDEYPRLQRIPQLEPAMSLQRAAGCPIVLASQGAAQTRETYGRERAESIASNAYTQIQMRTVGKSAEASSEMLGMPSEIERIRESKSAGSLFFHRPHNNYSTERITRPAVSAGEIHDLEDGFGFVSQAGKITPVYIPWRPPVKRNLKLIERTVINAPQRVTALPDLNLLIKRPYKPKLRGAAPGAASTSAVPVLVPPTVFPQDSPN